MQNGNTGHYPEGGMGEPYPASAQQQPGSTNGAYPGAVPPRTSGLVPGSGGEGLAYGAPAPGTPGRHERMLSLGSSTSTDDEVDPARTGR